MKKYLIGAAVCALALLAVPKPAGAVVDVCPSCVPHFNDSTGPYGTATLTIPADQGRWLLWMDEPDNPGQPIVGQSAAPAGATGGYTLTVIYPICFRGVIQADALYWNGDGWQFSVGHQETVSTSCPGTTTTTAPSTTTTTGATTTTAPVVTTTTTPVVPPTTPPTPPTPPVTQVSPAPGQPMKPISTTTPQLPFTGVNVVPYAIIGSGLLALGAWLVLTSNRRIWALRRAAIQRFHR